MVLVQVREALADAGQVQREALPDLPRGYTGPFVIPGNGRLVWWTGRVAIGLRYEPRSLS